MQHHLQQQQHPIHSLSRSNSGPCAAQPGASNYDVYLGSTGGAPATQHSHYHPHHLSNNDHSSTNNTVESAASVSNSSSVFATSNHSHHVDGTQYGQQHMYAAAYAYGHAAAAAAAAAATTPQQDETMHHSHHPLSRTSCHTPSPPTSSAQHPILTPPNASPTTSWTNGDHHNQLHLPSAACLHQTTPGTATTTIRSQPPSPTFSSGSSSQPTTAPSATVPSPPWSEVKNETCGVKTESNGTYVYPYIPRKKKCHVNKEKKKFRRRRHLRISPIQQHPPRGP
ncbi:hypothetical protein BX666DRAFT_8773 [Dichotomocladium elegans]|nr:hypothetical protein BX666DRAFT_8773 [Dichotomocladium elegans]